MKRLIEAMSQHARASKAATEATRRFGDDLYDAMNWWASLRVLRAMGRR